MLCATLAFALAMPACGDSNEGVPGFEDSALETFEIDVLPDPSRLGAVTDRPEERFVMLNMLAFKDMATGEGFENLTGREAYQLYIDGLQAAQMMIDSRLIWSGDVDAQVVGSSEPVFQSIALLEYASPMAFLAFAANPGDNPEARSAGLRGQWLVPSTTLAEGNGAEVIGTAPDALADNATLAKATGFSEAQIERVLDGPTDAPVFIVELLRFADGDRTTYADYEAAVEKVLAEYGAQFVWRGSYDGFVLGNAEPSFDEQAVTGFPNRAAYLMALSDPRVAAVASSRADGLAMHWIYTASDTGIQIGN